MEMEIKTVYKSGISAVVCSKVQKDLHPQKRRPKALKIFTKGMHKSSTIFKKHEQISKTIKKSLTKHQKPLKQNHQIMRQGLAAALLHDWMSFFDGVWCFVNAFLIVLLIRSCFLKMFDDLCMPFVKIFNALGLLVWGCRSFRTWNSALVHRFLVWDATRKGTQPPNPRRLANFEKQIAETSDLSHFSWRVTRIRVVSRIWLYGFWASSFEGFNGNLDFCPKDVYETAKDVY